MEGVNKAKYNDLEKDKMEEYNDFLLNDFDFKEEEHRKDHEQHIKQEIFNFKVERIIGIEKEKMEFDEKYKEPIIEYINKHSFK